MSDARKLKHVPATQKQETVLTVGELKNVFGVRKPEETQGQREYQNVSITREYEIVFDNRKLDEIHAILEQGKNLAITEAEIFAL